MTIVHVQQVKDAIVHIHISVVHVPLVIGPMQSLIFVNCAHRVPIPILLERLFACHVPLLRTVSSLPLIILYVLTSLLRSTVK
jgi:hypothetical protein